MKKILKNLFAIVICLSFCACQFYKPEISLEEAVKTGDKKAVAFYLKKGENANQKNAQL